MPGMSATPVNMPGLGKSNSGPGIPDTPCNPCNPGHKDISLAPSASQTQPSVQQKKVCLILGES